jgi:hypothetical protein
VRCGASAVEAGSPASRVDPAPSPAPLGAADTAAEPGSRRAAASLPRSGSPAVRSEGRPGTCGLCGDETPLGPSGTDDGSVLAPWCGRSGWAGSEAVTRSGRGGRSSVANSGPSSRTTSPSRGEALTSTTRRGSPVGPWVGFAIRSRSSPASCPATVEPRGTRSVPDRADEERASGRDPGSEPCGTRRAGSRSPAEVGATPEPDARSEAATGPGAASTGWVGRRSPSLSARRRTRSAWASSTEDE